MFREYPFARYFLNSFIISIGATLLSLIIGIPDAYSFTRPKFPGRHTIFYILVSAIMFPWVALVIPVYDIYTNLGLMNSYHGLIVIYTIMISPLCLWLLTGFF